MNAKVLDYLDRLAIKAKISGDIYRERAFLIAKLEIQRFKKELTWKNYEKMHIKGIGKGIKRRLIAFLKKGEDEAKDINLQSIKKYEKMKNEVIESFMLIHGVGKSQADKWFQEGYKTYDDLTDELTRIQKLSIRYIDETKLKIPRSEMDQYKIIFDDIMMKMNRQGKLIRGEIVGSYRRLKNESSDIDLLLETKYLNIFLRKMNKLFDIHYLSKGKDKILMIIKYDTFIHRRMDIEVTTKKSWALALLYFTGSKEFNIVMRHDAKQKGMILNQKYIMKKKKKYYPKTEEEIFKIIGMEYLEPYMR